MSDEKRLAVYLAGPEVFLPNGAEIGAAKQQICAQHGLEGLFPGDVPEAELEVENGRLLFRRLVQMMERADLIIANMTPFRGVSMDVGTAVEIGFMYSRGCRVFGYTNISADYAARVSPDGARAAGDGGALVAADGMSIEPFNLTDNLMCVAPVLESGATIVSRDVPADERFSNLAGFEECVRQAIAGRQA
jgi:nucleoside 2-deoxyribosyltransferase